MRNFYFSLISLFLLTACSTKNQLIYLKDIQKEEANSWVDISNTIDKIESGDILKIEVLITKL